MERRFSEIDALKSVGIATVVLIHSVRSPWDPTASALEIWIGDVTRFGVPAFLFASGFLYATPHSRGAAPMRQRLLRLLLPYLVASLLAQLLSRFTGMQTGGGSLARALLLGASLGPYYYVFVIAGLVMVTPLWARLPRAAVLPLTLGLVALQWYVDAATGLPLPLFWHLRNPMLWWAFFACGWLARLHYPELGPRAARAPVGLLLGLAGAAGLLALAIAIPGTPRLLARSAGSLEIYAILALLFAIGARSASLPAALRRLSDATYAIYLLHWPFVYAAQQILTAPAGHAAPLPIAGAWAAGLLGPLLLLLALRRLLGARSRLLFGA